MNLIAHLDRIGRAFVFERFRDPLRFYLLKAGIEAVPYFAFTVMFFASLGITYLIFFGFFFPIIIGASAVAIFLSTLVFWIVCVGLIVGLFMFFIWSYLNVKIYNRTKEMEERLPEYLALVVTNLRSGMSFDKSLWAAIRPEFGVLSREITMVSKQVMTGNDTSEALHEFAMRYESPILRRSINLIISEIESGGEVAVVIERVIENLRKTSSLKKEMAASVVSYMIFISIIVMFLAPILFALANVIFQVILGFADQIAASPGMAGSAGGAAQLFESMGRLAEHGDTLTSDFMTFSYLALGTISFFSAMIVSIIEKGDVMGGLKYIPVFMTVTLAVFYFAARAVSGAFGAFF